MKRITGFAAICLSACSGPSFEFRGYTNQSACSDIVTAEKQHGTVVQVSEEQVPNVGSATVTELAVELFGKAGTAKVACFSGGIVDVHYTVPGGGGSGTEASFNWLSDELRHELGPWSEESGTAGRIRTFVCGVPATVRLVEVRPSSEAPDGRVMLVVVPRSGLC